MVTVDHPGDSSEIVYPDGRVRRTGPRRRFRHRRRRPTGACGRQRRRTVRCRRRHARDRRIRAGVDLEGYLDHLPAGTGELLPVARHGLDRPLLLLGTDGFRDARLDRTWLPLARLDTTELVWLADAAHWGLSDYAALAPQLRDAGLMTAGDCAAPVGTGDPLPLVRRHVVDFLARHL
ncbi:hypothetical protein ABZ816_04545 [Actinosynnema sp. NPDC047251]|uniref:hypothetical protein n=1 Tax=Saccharothrix espanaensis TaxID=103731 RepID=UPI0002D5076E|nr:hypothetical protein [Saccharothrix espanaensis]